MSDGRRRGGRLVQKSDVSEVGRVKGGSCVEGDCRKERAGESEESVNGELWKSNRVLGRL